MKVLSTVYRYFSFGERLLLGGSACLILLFYLLFDRSSPLTLAASLVGVTSLVLNAKGNPIGQALMILFSILYGIISFSFAYYGEMITYLGMTLPMALLSLVAWLRHPYGDGHAEVRVARLSVREWICMALAAVLVTLAFFYILAVLGTENLLPSTVSVTTSFIAAYLTARRSRFFALAYAANDLVLILLWSMAALVELRYLSVALCFTVFFINDLYGFICWGRMEKRQAGN